MRKFILLSIAVLFSFTAFSQDFSNKGKDFWVGYGYHQVMTAGGGGGNGQNMVLYIATDTAVLTTVNIDIPGIGYSQTFNIPANTIFTTPTMPKGTPDARLFTEGTHDKGIHVTSNRDVVAYAHIYNSSVSGACVLLPTPTLGKEYYSINYTNNSNVGNANCWFYVIAADTGTTTVEITPSANTIGGWPAGVPQTVTLTQGQIYNVMGTVSGNTGVDLTGSKIRSIASGNGVCKRIAVYSGSGRIFINCGGGGTSSDNYMVQGFPTSTWGKRFLTSPTGGNMQNNIFRICVTDPTTVVRINGVVTVLPLQNNFFYEIPQTNQPQLIEADLPIAVAQYISTQNSCGNGNPGDPEVIYLSPVEQNIKDVLFNSNLLVNNPNPPNQPHNHLVNVIIPNGGIPSFRIDGVTPLPPAVFTTHPQDSRYSYITIANLAQIPHRMTSDSGFNAIAYGFATTESYGYNAGTNVKDLTQALEINNPNSDPSETSSACTNSPFKFKVYFPDSTLEVTPQAIRFDSMKWEILPTSTAFVPNNFPVMVYGTVGTPPTVAIDSVNVRNSRQVAWYSLPTLYTVTTPGFYTVKVTVYRTNSEGCGNSTEYEFPLNVSDPPTASFTAPVPGCYLEPLVLTETTPQAPKATWRWWWEVTELAPGPVITTTYTTRNVNAPGHIFTRPGLKRIRHASITTPGCLSDTIVQTITVPDVPNGSIAGTTSVCQGAPNPDLTITMIDGRAPYRFTYTINGVAQPPIVSPTGTYNISVPTGTPGTYIYELTEVRNDGSTVCVRPISGQTATVIVRPLPNAAIAGATTVCLNSTPEPVVTFTGSNATAPYTFAYTINGVAQTPIVSNAAGVATINAPTNVVGTFIYEITQVTDASSNTCNRNITGTTTTITVQDLPNAVIASSTTAVCQNATQPTVTFTGSVGTAPYTFNYTINGVAQTPVVSNAAGVATLSVPTGTVGTFVYEITQVREGSAQTCIRAITGQTVTITVNPLPNAAIAGAATVCLNSIPEPIVTFTGSNATAPYTFAYTINGVPQTPIVSNAAGVATINAPTNVVGSFVYAITQITDASSTACSRAISATSTTINVQDLPNGVIASSTTAVCLNSTPLPTITFTGNTGTAPYTFTYTINGVTQPTIVSNAAGVATINVPTNVATTYTYELTNISESSGQTCSRVITGQTRVVVVNPLPTATVTGAIAVCRNAAQPTVTFTGADATAPYTFNYTINGVAQPPLVSNAAGVATVLAPTNVAGIFTYQLTSVRDASSTLCSQAQTGSTVITINDLPVATFTPQAIRCANSVITFTNTSTPNAGGNTDYSWNFGDPNANGTNPNTATTNTASPNATHYYIVPNTAPGYTVTLTATNSNGCISDPIFTAIVPVNDTPRAGFIVPEVCINDVATVFTDTSRINPGNAITGWYWDFGDPPSGPLNTSTAQHGVHLYPTPAVYQVTHVAISDRGCRDTIIQPITINAADPVSNYDFINRTTLCSSDSVQLRNLSTVSFGNVSWLKIYWDVTNNPTVYDSIGTPVFNAIYKHKYLTNLQTTTSYNIRVEAYSGVRCSNSRPDAITVHATPIVQFNDMPPTCLLRAPFQITQGSEVGGVPGTGTYSGGAYITSGGMFNPQIAGVGSHPIKYTWTASNAGACIDTLTKYITVIDTASSLFTISSPTCDGQAVTFTDISDPRGNTLQTIHWDFGHAPPNNTATSLPGQAITHVFPTWGNYNVRMYTTSSAGCLSTTKQIPIYVSPIPNPVFAPEKVHYCLPSESNVKFINNSTIVDGTALTYSWNFDDPNATPSNPNTSTAVSPTHNYTSTGPFTVRLTATSIVGCKQDFDYNLTTVHPQPKAAFSTNKPGVCIADEVTFRDESDPKDGTTVTRYWDFTGSGTFISSTNPTITHTYPTVGTYAPTLYIVNSFGCHSDTLPRPFIVHPYPVVNAGKDRTILEFGSVKLDPTVTGEDLEYLWTPNIYFNNNNRVKQPTASLVKDDITYKLTVTSRGGCTATDDVFIKVLKFPKIPNTFTPNNDGINDVWRIEYLDSYPNCRVQVFSRTGQLVFESKGIYKSWDGTMQGKSLPVDTYYYVIEPGNGRDPVTGYVTIVK